MGTDNDTTDTDATSGQSDQTTDQPTTDPKTTDAPLGDKGQETLAKERTLRREAEKAAKTLQAQLEELQKGQMSETEKAIAEAKKSARIEVLAEVGGELVESAMRVQLAGRAADVDAAIDAVDRSKFLTEDGRPDTKKIGDWVDRCFPKQEQTRRQKDLGQGNRGGGDTSPQIRDRADIKNMTPKQITEARRAGRLDDLMSGRT